MWNFFSKGGLSLVVPLRNLELRSQNTGPFGLFARLDSRPLWGPEVSRLQTSGVLFQRPFPFSPTSLVIPKGLPGRGVWLLGLLSPQTGGNHEVISHLQPPVVKVRSPKTFIKTSFLRVAFHPFRSGRTGQSFYIWEGVPKWASGTPWVDGRPSFTLTGQTSCPKETRGMSRAYGLLSSSLSVRGVSDSDPSPFGTTWNRDSERPPHWTRSMNWRDLWRRVKISPV